MKKYRVYMSNGVGVDIQADDWRIDRGNAGYIFLVNDSVVARFDDPIAVIDIETQKGGNHEN